MKKKLKHVRTTIGESFTHYEIAIDGISINERWNYFIGLSEAEEYLIANFVSAKGKVYAIVQVTSSQMHLWYQ